MIGAGLFAVEKQADRLPPIASKFAIPGETMNASHHGRAFCGLELSMVVVVLLLAIPASFYLILRITGTSMDDARRDGWMQGSAGPDPSGSSTDSASCTECGGDAGTAFGVVSYWFGPWFPFFRGKLVWSVLPGMTSSLYCPVSVF